MFLNIVLCLYSLMIFKADSLDQTFSDEEVLLLRFKQLLVDIREMNISPEEAEVEFKGIMRRVSDKYPSKDEVSELDLIFPLLKSNIHAVGGKGTGFYARTFNLFDQTVKGSHPAHDIFIYDPDRDDRDDRTHDYVGIVAVSNGVVIAVEQNWEPESGYRGGNYVWIYDYDRKGLWYYAHAREVFVEVGQRVVAGNKIAEVGRTGFNALSNRSDTHLHLMFLKLDEDFYPKPVNYYEALQKAQFLDEGTVPEKRSFRTTPDEETTKKVLDALDTGNLRKP